MRRKGWFTVLLAAVMALAMTPVIASATEWGDDYNTAETLYIATTEDFLTFVEMSQSGATFEGKTVILRNSLDLDGVSIGPIGVDNYMTYSFMGTFDGQGNSITGLSISLPPYSTTNCALFGKIENGTVRSLTLENAEIPSDTFGYTAGIAGELDNGTVENCHVINSNITVSTSMYAGGIVGLNNGGTITGCSINSVEISAGISVGGIAADQHSGTISDCTTDSETTISGFNSVGGIIGNISGGSISNCINEATVTTSQESTASNKSGFGGIAGSSRGLERYDITGCVNRGLVDAEGCNSVGGIIGNSVGINVTDCLNEENVIGSDNVGGIAGNMQIQTTVSGCTNSGEVTGNDNVGGVAGQMVNNQQGYAGGYPEITDCISGGTITGITNVGGIAGFNDDFSTNHGSGYSATDPARITGCTVMPDCSVTGTENVGAIIGDNASGFSGDGAKPGIINTNIWPEALGNSPAAAGTGSEGNDGEGVTNNSAYGEDGQLNEPVTVGEEGGQTTVESICDVIGHDLRSVEGQAASCGKDGYQAYYICDLCNKLFADEAGETEIEKPMMIPATGEHTYEDGVCSVCGVKDPNYRPHEEVSGDNGENGSKGTLADRKDGAGTAQTGDDNSEVFWILIVSVAAIGATGTIVYGRKRGRE